MQNPFAVRTLLFRSGERFPILIASETGEPDFDVTVYVLTHLRATGKASNTIEHHLRSIVVLKLYLQFRAIDLGERVRSREMLRPYELDELIKWCKRSMPSILADFKVARSNNSGPGNITASIYYRKRKQPGQEVCGQTGVNRAHAVRDFMDWFVRDRVTRLDAQDRSDSIRAWQMCRTGLEARIPRNRRRNQLGRREGAHPDTIANLLAVVEPASLENPWKSDHVKSRNQLIVHWLYQLGIRRGELLNIKISDINFRRETVIVVRRADDNMDPRKNQPLVKTRDRDIPLGSSLVSMTMEYITKYRAKCSNARLHEFLFVSERSGAPLSLSMVNEIFESIRNTTSDVFEGLSPHVLRHTWNDNFSERSDELKLSSEDEVSMRSYMMGWSPTSDTASTYTRRHVRKKAQQVSLAMQAKLFKQGERDE